MGESKWDILKLLPPAVLPKMIPVEAGAKMDTVLSELEAAEIEFPLITKPDIGERGFLVKKLEPYENKS